MSDQAEVEQYNYEEFVGSEDFMAFRTILSAGERAPDFDAVLLKTGELVRLSDYWKKADVLLEFGSVT